MDGLRVLPAVDRLAAELDAPHALAVAAARAVIDERRAELRAGRDDEPDLVARARERLARERAASLRRVLNATGVIVHTNLGRAPLAARRAGGGRAHRRPATRTSSGTSRAARAARATTTSRRCSPS